MFSLDLSDDGCRDGWTVRSWDNRGIVVVVDHWLHRTDNSNGGFWKINNEKTVSI